MRGARQALATAVVVLAVAGVFAARARQGGGDIVLGRPSVEAQQALPGPTIVLPERGTAAERPPDPHPAPRAGHGRAVRVAEMRWPDASPYGDAVTFHSDTPVPDSLVFVLVAGSDARPGEAVDRTRADSIHLLALNPRSGTGTVVGIPRDTWTEIPGHGRGKVNTALALGGMDLLASTVRRMSGLPIHYWVLTGFTGFEASVDALGGVVVPVERRMADRASGAFFEPGWHRMSGRDALAFSRNRKDVPDGDFGRSQHQGVVLLSALAKMRVEVSDMEGVRRWVDLVWRHVRLDTGLDEAVRLAATARRVDPKSVANVVAPGTVGSAGGQSVVYLTSEAAALFQDLRDDATIGAAPPPTTTTTATTTTTTTTPVITTTTAPLRR